MGRIITNQHGHKLHTGGRKRPVVTPASHPHLFRSVKKYLTGTVPDAPDYDYFAAASTAEHDILANDQLGDCTAAGACHLAEVFSANAGTPAVLTRDDAIKFYSLSTGYDPNDPSTDQGGDEVQVCNTWRDKGLDGNGAHAIKGYLVVDATDPVMMKYTGWLFEGHYYGLELDSSWPQSVSGDGFIWDTGTPNPNEGHCIVSASAKGLRAALLMGVNSWGYLGWLTQSAQANFLTPQAGGNAFVIVTDEIVARATQKAPNGLDWMTLMADVQSLGGFASS